MAMKLLKTLLALAALAATFASGYIVSATKRSAPADGRRVLYYVDPMHPAYTSDKPGTAPDCGMALQPVYDQEGQHRADAADSSVAADAVRVGVQTQQLMGMRVTPVERSAETQRLRLYGR